MYYGLFNVILHLILELVYLHEGLGRKFKVARLAVVLKSWFKQT